MEQGSKNSDLTQSKIRSTLIKIGAIDDSQVELFATGTRDNPFLNVYRDLNSEVIFIDDFYTGDSAYASGAYRVESNDMPNTTFQDLADSDRRFSHYRSILDGKEVCDFACGAGTFLRLAESISKSICGVELQEGFVQNLIESGISCHPNMEAAPYSLDLVTMFHCLEHLPDPLCVLDEIRQHLKQNSEGYLVVEVPHARDFLINNLKVEEFIKFTLWSQHLVLHTKKSLHLLLTESGFKNIRIKGVQRYGLPNHFNWLKNKKPGGNNSGLSFLQSVELDSAYEQALIRIDATDTIVATAST